MVVTLSLVVLALRAGLAIRKRRLAGLPRKPDWMRRHLRFAKPAVGLAMLGFAGGGVSAIWLREWEPLRSLHGGLAIVAVLLFGVTAWLGQRLESGEGAAARHGALGLIATLVALLAAMAGFVLLP